MTLPIESFYPALRDKIASESIVLAEGRIKKAVETTAKVIAERKALAEQIASIRAGEIKLPSTRTNFLSDPFDKEQPAVWKRVSGKWKYEDGKLSESLVTSFATMVTKQDHPTDFRVKVRYRPLQPGHYRSVGFSFDYVSQTQSQDVYTSTGNAAQSVQAFHRTGGKNHYPREGIVKTQLKVGEITTVEAEVRGERLKIWLNGEEKLDYRMPIPRRAGKFALWVHSGAAEFLDLEIKALTKTLEDLEREHAGFGDTIAASKKDEEIAAEQVVSLKARQAAERAKYSASASGKPEELAKAAAKAEARVKLMEAERDLILAVDKNSAGKKVADAKKALEKAGTKYEPLGEVFPKTSTGRRAALARWIASAENPRTARVAVNHMWLRHFGTALVPSVANFGPAGKPPTHPELLDWLAAELVENGWSMKHLHRLMVMSAAYQRSSKAMEQSADSDNRFYWRMNSRRMEAEVVRDSLLYIAGNLSTEMGGEDLDEKHGATSNRRSLYFRTTPDNQMPMLSAFDLANPNACYQREASVVPHQALTLMNGGLALDQARLLAGKLSKQVGAAEEHDGAFICAAHVAILNRVPSDVESRLMAEFLVEQRNTLDKPAGLKAFPGGGESKVAPSKDHVQRARENLVHALFSHNEFVTIR